MTRLNLIVLHHCLPFTFFVASLLLPGAAYSQINSTWIGGTGIWKNAANWDTIDFPSNNGTDFYNAFINGAGDNVSLSGLATVDSLTTAAGSQLDILNNSTLTIVNAPGRVNSGSLFNGGDINLNATSLGSTLRFEGEVTLDGSGTINMGNDAGNQLTGTSGGHLINENNLIRGSGTIGTSNTLQLTNRGSIVADQSVDLDIVLSQGVTNEGLFEANSGATMGLNGGIVENATGTIEAKTGSTIDLSGATIRGGLLRTTGSGQFTVNTATVDSSANATTLDGDFNVLNNRTLTVIGDLTNQQNINLNATSLGSTLRIDGEVSLSGGGSVNMGNDNGNQIVGQSGGKLINVNNLIHGSGTIGTSGTLELINNHQVISDESIGLTMVMTPGATNNGLFRATNGSTLTLNGGILDNTNGTIEAQNNSTVDLLSATVQGGLLQSFGTGTFDVINSSATLDGTNGITLDGTLNVGNNRSLTLIHSLTNQGNTINLNATSLASTLLVNGEVTLDGGGSVVMSNDAGNRITGTGGGKLINVDNTIRGAGVIGIASTLELVNHASIIGDQSAGLQILGNPGVTNDGVIRATSGGTVQLSGGTFNNVGGLIEADNASAVNLAGATIQGGTMRSNGSGVFTVISGNATLDGSASPLTLDGTVNVANNRALNVTGDINHVGNTINLGATSLSSSVVVNGTTTLTGGGTINTSNDAGNRISGLGGAVLVNEDNLIRGSGNFGFNTVSFINRGTFDAHQTVGLTIDPSAGGFLNDTTGTVRVSNSGGLTIAAGGFDNRGSFEVQANRTANIQSSDFVNQGLVSIDVGGLFDVTGTYTQTGGQTALQGLLDSSTLNDFDGGILSGNGIVNGSADFAAAAGINPGNSAGIITFSDELMMAGTFEMELGGTLVDGLAQVLSEVNTGTDPTLIDFDQVNVFDTVTLADGTTFDLDRIDGFIPQVGDFFDLLTGDAIVLQGTLDILTDSPALTFDVSLLTLFDDSTGTNRDVLRFTTLTTVPEPNAAIVAVMIGMCSLARRRNRAAA